MSTDVLSEQKVTHTPGLWLVQEKFPSVAVVRGATGEIAHVFDPIVSDCPTAARIERNMNARLIAAAPEMLEALKVFYAAYEKQDSAIPDSDLDNEQPKHVTVTLGDLRRLRVLIVKAEGRS